ncbi:MAG: type II toxin-antitoxin system RelE/ParE family toxin [Spirochaetota bacterium]
MYELRFLKPAEHYSKKIRERSLKEAFRTNLAAISAAPYRGEQKKGNLAGVYFHEFYHNRTNFEIAYRIYEEQESLVVAIMAGTRENLYEQLKRYMK